MSNYHERIAALSQEQRALLKLKLKRKKKECSTVIPQRAANADSWPLSLNQERLWFIHQLDPHNPAYNINLALRLKGKFALSTLEQSLCEIVRRHESLRTVFVSDKGQPSQLVLPVLKVEIPQIELEGVPEEEWEENLLKACTQHALRPFDLTKAPLFRVLLIKKNEAEQVLLVIMHHIITDWWSMNIFTKELSILYYAYTDGRPSPLPELPVQYADLAGWQRRCMEEADIEKIYEYWKRQLTGVPWVLELPTPRPRPAMQTFRGTTYPFTVSRSLQEDLKLLARSEDCSLFMVTLAAFELLIHRYSGLEEFIIGTPVANRNRVETKGMIGYLLDMLVIRADLTRNPPCREFLRRVRKTVLEAYDHQDIPFGELVKRLNPERDLSRSPLVQVSFIFLQSVERSAIGELASDDVSGLSVAPLSFDHGTARYDVTFCLWETREGLTGRIDYNTDLYDADAIERMAGHFQTLLTAMLSDPDTHVNELPLLTPAEQRLLLCDWNSTAADYPASKCLHRLFEEQAARTPEAVAVVSDSMRLTYAELNARVNRLARRLQEWGVSSDVLVALSVERSVEMVVGLLGILKAGGAYVPLDPYLPHSRLAFMLEDSGASVLLTQESLSALLPEHNARVFCLDSDWPEVAQHDASNLPEAATPDNLAYIIYTSGSTGKPKGVQVQHRALTNILHSMLAQPGLSATDVMLGVTTLSFDIAGLEIYLPLVAGARLVLAPDGAAADGVRLCELIAEHNVSLMQATPSTWRLMLDAGWHVGGRTSNERLRVLCGGEALPRQLAGELLERAGALWNMYGPTETTIWSTLRRIEAMDESVLIGRPIANTQVYLLGADLRPVPVDVTGELCIGGEGVARGYWQRPELTAERFVPDAFSSRKGARLYRTGDLARYTSAGEIEYLGRLDQQVKVRGHRIELGEIESTLLTHASVRDVAVVAREDRAGDKRLAAYVICSSDGGSFRQEVRQELRLHLKERLPEYMVPQHFVLLDKLPLTPNGKLDRRALPTPDESRTEAGQYFVAASTIPAEEILAGIWSELLGIKRVGLHDNFFEIGGHSLLASQIISRVREVFNVSVPLRRMFDAPTIAGLAAHVERLRRSDTGEKILPCKRVSREGFLPLSFAQQRLWFIDQMEPGSGFYNIPVALRLKGELEVEALEFSLNGIIRRHEALRTTFATVAGEPMQVISNAWNLHLDVEDISSLSEAERTLEVERRAEAESRQGFDLGEGPLLRLKLLRLAADEHLLLLTMHQIIADGWSMGILVREVVALYEAHRKGVSAVLPELPIQYADYAVWQREYLSGKVLEQQLTYWTKQLAGAPAVLDLPLDRPRPDEQTYRGAQQEMALNANLSDELRALSRRESVTLYMTLLAAFDVLLYYYTRNEDIVVGTGIANRNQLEVEGLIGCFVNQLALRVNLSGDQTFRELLQQVREVTLEAYAHQEVPFDRLVEALKQERSLKYSPVFQVRLILQNTPMTELEIPGLSFSPIEVNHGTTQLDLNLRLTESEQSIVGSVEYSTDLFNASTITRILRGFETLAMEVVKHPEARLSELIVKLDEQEKQHRDDEERELKQILSDKLTQRRRTQSNSQ
jgi:amino acid adenylation domain-containing protein